MATTLNKLEYTNETKEQMKTALNKFGSGITDETTFRNYVDKINDIYDNWTKVTGEETHISLNNTKASAKLSLSIKGNGGKQLFVPFSFSKSSNHISFTYDTNGGITADGTSTGDAFSMFTNESTSYQFTLQAGTYTLSGATVDIRLQLNNSSGSNVAQTTYNTTSVTFTIEEETVVFLRAYVPNAKTLNNETIYPMLESGSTVHEWEAYGYKVTGDNTIEINGIQLFEDEYIPVPADANINAHLKQGTYTIATCDGNNWGKNIYFRLFQNDTKVTTSGHLIAQGFTFSTNSRSYYGGETQSAVTFTIDDDYTVAIGLLESDNTRQVMLVVGENIVRTYEPYKTPQTQLISLGSIGLITGDEIVKVNNKYYINSSSGTEITDTTLKGQLDNLENLKSYDTQTNITSTYASGNAQMIIGASALKKGGN